MKYILFTLAKLLEIVEGSEKIIAAFKWVIKKRNKLGFDKILILEGLS